MNKKMNFQVNLQGIIDLLSNHLYSDPDLLDPTDTGSRFIVNGSS